MRPCPMMPAHDGEAIIQGFDHNFENAGANAMANDHNPWVTLSSKLVYENPWLRVRENQVINPNGGKGIYGLVKFRNRAVGIIPIDEQGYTWLVGQYRYATDAYSWEIPMGGQPMDEDPLEGAKRELTEETGLSAQRFEAILKVDISNSVSDEKGIVYLAEGLSQGETNFDKTEDLSLKRLPIKEAIEWAMDGRIQDGLSVTALLKLALMKPVLARS